MPQPVLSGAHRICTFGGLALPNGQGTMVPVDLNDLSTCYLQDEALFDIQAQLSYGQNAWQGEGAFLGSDFPALPLRLPMEYRDTGAPLGALLPKLLFAGEQRLTFDNQTCILVRCPGTSGRQTSFRRLGSSPLIRWTFDLSFIAREPWWRDIASTTLANQALASGSTTTWSITYGGSVFAKPVWVLTIPSSNAAPIQSFSLSNTMAGETLAIAFPGNLAASTAWTITIDGSAQTVADGTGHQYDFAGTFPRLYQPSGQVNAMSATLTPASGTATGCTIGGSVTNRWAGA